jgi:hypothetical protein
VPGGPGLSALLRGAAIFVIFYKNFREFLVFLQKYCKLAPLFSGQKYAKTAPGSSKLENEWKPGFNPGIGHGH